MHRYFLAPRSGETSYKNFVSTIKHGVPFGRIEDHLTPEGRVILGREEVIYAWGNREGKKAEWNRMSEGDTVIFYASKNFVMAGKIIFKQHSADLALAMWPPDEKGNPWAYTFFISGLQYFRIPLSTFNLLSGYNMTAVMGFTEIREDAVAKILESYKSFDALFADFTDETSAEIPAPTDHVYVNVPSDVMPIVSTKDIAEFVPAAKTGGGNRRSGYVDFEEVHRHRAKIGSRGEEVVLKFERNRLVQAGRRDLADKVTQVSADDTYAGYDIASFDENGREIKIEVKATTAKQGGNFSFHISRNEMLVAERESNYFVYLVYAVNTNSPSIHIVRNPFKTPDHLSIEPVHFVVRGRFT